MMGILRAEMLKYKRTFMAKLVIFIPLFFAVYSLVTSYLVPGSYDWNGILVMSFNWWPVTFLPLGYGLFAGMVANLERKAGNYRVLKGEVLSPRRIWLGKILGMALIAACSSAVLVLGDLVCGMLQGDVPPLGVMLLAALSLWLAFAFGMGVSIGVGMGGMLIAAILGGTLLGDAIWPFVPWAWPVRLASAVAIGRSREINAALVEAFMAQAGLACALALVGGMLLIVGGCAWFSRWDGRDTGE